MPIHDELIQHIEEDSYTKESLNFIGKEITDEYVVRLAQALKQNSYIKKLDLNCKNIGDEAVMALASVPNLEELDISETEDFHEDKITSEGIRALSLSNLKSLNLSYIQVDDEGIESLSKNSTILDLNISSSYNFSSEAIAHFIANNHTVEILNISVTCVGNEGLKTLYLNTTLKELYINDNGITDLGSKYISQNKALIKLHLTNNNIEDEGAIMLASHPNLTTLNLHNNQIGNRSMKAFSQNLQLKELQISGNKVTNEGIKILSKNTNLKTISLGNNEIDDNCIDSIASMQSLDNVNLFGTNITNNGLNLIQKTFTGIETVPGFCPFYDFIKIKPSTINTDLANKTNNSNKNVYFTIKD